MNPAKRRAVFERLSAAHPSPRSELDYHTPFELLVAVVLSAQSTDKGVNKATAVLFPVANTPEAFVRLGVDGLIPYISSIGLFRNKAKHIVALSQALLAEHGGAVPTTREDLRKLPGVGRKTADVVLNVAFNQPVIPVDTHIFRVANRTGLARGRDADAVADQLERIVPDDFKHDAHHWLILHGRYVCVARKPRCAQCPIRELCEYQDKTPATDAIGSSSAKARAPGTAQHPREPPVKPASRSTPKSSAVRGRQPFAKTARAGTGRGSGGGRKR